MVPAIRSRAARGKLDRQIFIHIGTYKTATTSIQGLMARAERPFARHGIFIPKAGVIARELFGHHNIGWTLRADKRANPQWGNLDGLCAELSRTRLKQALISSEDFEYLVDYPDLLKMIEQRLSATGWTPTYLLFLRDPTDYAISLFFELSRNHGFKDTFSDFIGRLLMEGKITVEGDWTYYLDYAAFIAKWRSATTGDLRVYSYDDARKNPGVLEAFLQVLGLPADPRILNAPVVRPLWTKRLSYAWRGRKLPAPPADPAMLNVNPLKVTDEMRAEAARISSVFALPRDLMTPIAPAAKGAGGGQG